MSERQQDKKKKETILDLGKYLDKKIRVKFSGGREVSGVLKGDFLKTPKKTVLLHLIIKVSIHF